MKSLLTTVLALSFSCVITFSQKQSPANQKEEIKKLRALNAQFIRNFIDQDTASHNKILHKDFVCIESTGKIVERGDYLKEWAHGYENSGYTSFSYTDEFIRVFGDMALIRSRTVYKKSNDTREAYTIYTDTYVKENGKWLCVQAQITPVKK